jgi:hypothetical protein
MVDVRKSAGVAPPVSSAPSTASPPSKPVVSEILKIPFAPTVTAPSAPKVAPPAPVAIPLSARQPPKTKDVIDRAVEAIDTYAHLGVPKAQRTEVSDGSVLGDFDPFDALVALNDFRKELSTPEGRAGTWQQVTHLLSSAGTWAGDHPWQAGISAVTTVVSIATEDISPTWVPNLSASAETAETAIEEAGTLASQPKPKLDVEKLFEGLKPPRLDANGNPIKPLPVRPPPRPAKVVAAPSAPRVVTPAPQRPALSQDLIQGWGNVPAPSPSTIPEGDDFL